MRWNRLMFAMLAFAATPAAADPITYSFTGQLSYTLNDVVFDDAAVRFTLMGDTDDVVQIDDSPVIFNSAPGVLNFTLNGVSGQFDSAFNAFATTFASGRTAIGFTEVGESDIFEVRTTNAVNYDLRTAIGPISNDPLGFLNFDTPFGTTAGTLVLLDDDDNRLTFRATLAGVPEPATWAVMTGGIAVAGGALRRRRKAEPAEA